MSEVIIVLLLLIPIFLVVAILNNSHKKQKKKAAEKITAYINNVAAQLGISQSFQQRLVHQTVLLDENSKKLLVVNHKDSAFAHAVYDLRTIKSVKVKNCSQTWIPEGRKKPETFTTQIGVEIIPEKAGAEMFLALYDHVEHNIMQMTGFQEEARELQDRILQAMRRQSSFA